MDRAVLLLCLLAGCASGVSADQACTDTATAFCAKLDACHVGGVALRYGDMAICVARNRTGCLLSLGAPDTGRTPDNQQSCAAAYAGASCADFLQNAIAACQPPAGTRALYHPCAYSAQCHSGFCSLSPYNPCGRCAPVPAVGDSCTTSQCGGGQVCAEASSTCQPYGAAGAPCSTSGECQAGLGCVGAANGNGAGQCEPTAAGASGDRKAGPICDSLKGLYCSFMGTNTAGTCTSYLHATAGQPCGFAAGTAGAGSSYTLCSGGAACILPQGQNAGTCRAYAIEGHPCDAAKGPACLAPARCVISSGGTAGTCQLPDPIACQ